MYMYLEVRGQQITALFSTTYGISCNLSVEYFNSIRWVTSKKEVPEYMVRTPKGPHPTWALSVEGMGPEHPQLTATYGLSVEP